MTDTYHCDACGVVLPDHEYGEGMLCPTCEAFQDCPEGCLFVYDEKPGIPMCGRCYDVGPVFPAECAEKPELLAGQPLGQYHCPDCGAMVLAGIPHPPMCRRCTDRVHPEFDVPHGTLLVTDEKEGRK
jgi:hypothetical protein